MSETWTMPKESPRNVGPITVSKGGVPTTSFKLAIVREGDRPTTYSDPTVVGSDRYIAVAANSLAVGGRYRIWAEVTESSVVVAVLNDVGRIVIT